MSWASKAYNQWITFSDAQESGIYQKEVIPTSTQWMNKSAALYFLDVDPSYLHALDNEWVTKSEMVGYPNYNWLEWYYEDNDDNVGDSMRIIVNGTELVNVSSNDSGTFAIHEGDVVTITVQTADYGYTGNSADMFVGGDNGLGYDLIIDGLNTSDSFTFTWHSLYHATQVVCLIQNRTYVPTPTEYYNTEQTKPFWKDDCGTGYIGSLVNYTISANTYLSHVSQANANWMAQKAIDLIGQSNANTYGTCIYNAPGVISYAFNDNIVLHPVEQYDYIITKNDVIMVLSYGLVEAYGPGGSFSVSDGDVIMVYIIAQINETGVLNITGTNFTYTQTESSRSFSHSFTYKNSYQEVKIHGEKYLR